MNDTPFTIIGDEPIEARIVAWVLGEASGFEAAELERMCEERPELLVFRRRMIALHGLLAEAEAAHPDEGWKLPQEKRMALDEVFGAEKSTLAEPVIERRIRRSGRRMLLAIAACLMLTFVVIGLFSTAGTGVKKSVRMAEKKVDFMPAAGGGGWGAGARYLSEESDQNTVLPDSPDARRVSESSATGLGLAKNEEASRAIPAPRGMIVDRDGEQSTQSTSDHSLAKNEAPSPAKPSAPLTTALPPELIEGTPKPINVPNLETPVNGPAGLASLSGLTKSGLSTLSLSGKSVAAKETKKDDSIAADEMPEVALEPPATPPPARQPRPRAMPLAGEKRALAEGSATPMAIDEPNDSFGEMATLSTLSAGGKSTGTSGGLGGSGSGKFFDLEKGSGGDSGVEDDGRLATKLRAGSERKSAESGENYHFSSDAAGKKGDSPVDGKGPTPDQSDIVFTDVDAPASESSVANKDGGKRSGGTVGLSGANTYNGGTTVTGGVLNDHLTGYTGERVQNDEEGATHGKIPTLADVPVFGRLFSEQSDKQEELQVPKITTRSAGDDIDGDERKITASIVSGNRSGDYANTRNNIDAVLNNPDRVTGLDEAEKLRKVGKDTEAREILEKSLAAKPGDAAATDALKRLDDPIRTNPAITYEHTQKVDEVRRGLYRAEGNLNLGKYDEAKKEYENTLRADPYNQAARKGLEKIAAAKSDYYRAAYDQTRAELLAQVDQSWEMAVPADGIKGEGKPINEDGMVLENLKANEAPPPPAEIAAKNKATPDNPETATRQEDIRDQEDKVEEGRKQLKQKLQGASQPAEPEKPKIDLTKLMEEISASEDPYSTFSLNISDASFKIAQAAMAKGERPAPAGVKVEQFYNAVDYGDPSPGKGEPVAVHIEQSAHPVIPGRNLVRVALKTAAAGRSASQPLRLTLLVDQSGSMVREDRRAAMDKALASLSGLLTKNDRVTVIGFSRTPHLLAKGMTGDQAVKLKDLVNQAASEGGTNLEVALNLATQEAGEQKTPGAQNRIVLFTDGAANLGDANPAHLAEKVKVMRQNGIAFDIAGIAADDLNDDLLGDLARNGNGRYYVVGKGDEGDLGRQLAGAFRPAAENVKVQVRFNPERVARYKLIGFEKDRLKTEDFRNDSVDAAELAAEEAGVAIYQVEPIPGGTGELGEVSVRFRDAAAGQMVERTWAIPHDAKSPVIDQASPSMQLAVLSMLAAEKLKGGPLAEAIDFKQLAAPRANVRHFYGNAGRVAEMMNMVDALK